MFALVELKDIISSVPTMLGRNFRDILMHCIDSKYANRVIPHIGLVVCFYDFIHVGDAELFHGEASPHTQVHFRLLVFQPFEDEILLGKVQQCLPEGIVVSMDFFNDVLIPAAALQSSSELYVLRAERFYPNYDTGKTFPFLTLCSISDENIVEQPVWLWKYNDEEEGEVLEYYIEPEKTIRFRVVSTVYKTGSKDAKPRIADEVTPDESDSLLTNERQAVEDDMEQDDSNDENMIVAGGEDSLKLSAASALDKLGLHGNIFSHKKLSVKSPGETLSSLWPSSLGKQPCMLITGSIAEDGLGMLHWWEGDD